MNVEPETVLILLLVGVVLAPMWFFAFQSVEAHSPVELSDDRAMIDPTGRFLPTPPQVSEFVAGVITWIALFVLVGLIFVTHSLIRRGSRSGDSPVADGGPAVSLPSYLLTRDRRLVDYWPASYSTGGLAWIAVAAVATIGFAVLFAMEALTLARTQFLGVYGGMVFLSLGALVAVYATWFMPAIHVTEERHHEELFRTDTREDDR